MSAISLIATMFILFVSAPAFAQDWIEYKNMKDSFSITFPGEPSVKETTYTSEYHHVLPARVYGVDNGPNHYSVTVVDYTPLEQMEKDRIKSCRDSGKDGDTCMDIYMHDMRGAIIFATWSMMKKAAKVTLWGYSRQDLVEGNEVYLTNPDGTRTFAGVYMHENHLFIINGTVPADAPPPVLFYTTMGFLDKDGKNIRYATPYQNGLPVPKRANE